MPLPSLVRLSLTAASGRDVDRILNIPGTTLPNLRILSIHGQPFTKPSFASFPTPFSSAITSLAIETRAAEDATRDELHAFPAAKIFLLLSGTPYLEQVVADTPR